MGLLSGEELSAISSVVVGLIVVFVLFDGALLAQVVRRQSRSKKKVLGALETQVLWTLVPAFILALFLSLNATNPSNSDKITRTKETPNIDVSTKVVFE